MVEECETFHTKIEIIIISRFLTFVSFMEWT